MGRNPAIINIDSTSYNFGNVFIGETKSPKTFSITNTGEYNLTVSSINLSGQQSNNFNLLVNDLP
jgi:hypothetical protein